MATKLLILGGTTEASALARAVAKAGIPACLSYAGRVADPAAQPIATRIGGFGGPQGLAQYLAAQEITHMVDATHPFAAQMSTNACAACAQTGVKLMALSREQWAPVSGDRWTCVPDIAAAVDALDQSQTRVFLAVGRMHLAQFAVHPQHFYLLRLVDDAAALPFPDCQSVISKGPFTLADDLALLRSHRINSVVSKNSGGAGAYAKIAAARELGLGVIMIDRPKLPVRAEVSSVDAVMDWIVHSDTERGV